MAQAATTATRTPIDRRWDFILLFDVQDGNPNGDPDNANLPRIDPETGQGLVTDVCLKRKLRNYVALAKENAPPFEIYVAERAILNKQHERAYQALGLDAEGEEEAAGGAAGATAGEDGGKASRGRKPKRTGGDAVPKARAWMCANFYDVRTFGAVMSTGVNAGQVRGPVQLTFARSVGPVAPAEHAITRMAVATEREAEAQRGDNRTMGRKATLPYGLYCAHGFVSAALAKQTGFDQADLDLLWDGLRSMFEHDRSAARGMMTTRRLVAFEHRSALGNAPAHALFERVKVERRAEVPRAYADFAVTVNRAGLPGTVTLHDWAA